MKLKLFYGTPPPAEPVVSVTKENGLADRYREAEQLEYASERLLQQNRDLMKKRDETGK